MKSLLRWALVGLALVTWSGSQTFTQVPSPSPGTVPQKNPGQQDEVVRVTTNLVQVDVTVVDKNNQPVTDLKPEDFEIREDDRVQKISSFSFVAIEPPGGNGAAPANAAEKNNAPVVPPSSLLPSQVKRTMALVVDDIGLSLESTEPVRQAIRKFVADQMQPGDLVAIIRTSGGVGVLQQFTTDKQRLYAAINDIRWRPSGRSGVTSVEQVTGRYDSTEEVKDLLEFRSEILSAGTFGALSYVIRGLKDLPGRKSVVFFSESLRITSAKGRVDRLLAAMNSVVEEANRASVVLYTQDASGLQPLTYSAADSPSPGTNDISVGKMGSIGSSRGSAEVELAQLRALADQRNVEYETHTVLDFLAQGTGGTFTRFNNDLNAAIRGALEDQKSYYLIGYRPDESSFDPITGARRLHKWDIRVKRPGLKVRHRNGFYGVADAARQDASLTPQAQLTKALVSPFSSGDIHVRLTSLFRGDASTTPSVNSLIHIDGRDLTLKEAGEGFREGSIDVVAMAFGDNGTVINETDHTQTIRIRNDTYERFLKNGLAYNLSVPVKNPGAYQLRIAVRDAATGRIGSAGQFVEVPDLTKGHLSLSSIVISSGEANPAPANSADQDQFEQQITSAVRQLRHGTLLDYGYVIYNAQMDRAKKRPQVQTQIRLLKDGQVFFAGKLNDFDLTGQTDMKQLIGGGRLQVGTAMAAGQYILQLTVIDQLAKEKFRTSSQWIDFEVLP
jgi:VWFA-related protein